MNTANLPFPEGRPGVDPASWAGRLARKFRRETAGMTLEQVGRYADTSFDAVESGVRGVSRFADSMLSEAILSGKLSHDATTMRYRIRLAVAKLRAGRKEGAR